MRIAVVSANIGSIDTPKMHEPQTTQVDYYCFDDNNSPYPMQDINSRLKGKYFKMLTHKLLLDYDVFIWVDGNIQIKSKNFVSHLVFLLGNYDIAISKHPFRKTPAEEVDFICNEIDNGNKYLSTRYTKEAMRKELEFIGDADSLYWCGLFIRRNKPEINELFEKWFDGNVLYQAFDQNLFSKYATEMNLTTFDLGSFYDNDYYSLTHHSKLQ